MKTVFKRLAGFIGFPMISLVAPFIILPIISRIVGDAGWANYTAGQAIGVLAAIGILFGWGVLGPVRIAAAKDHVSRQEIYRDSLYARLTTFVVITPLSVVVTLVITSSEYKFESILMTISGALVGLGPNWYCIGLGRPWLMGKYDAIPRILVSFAAIPIVWLTSAVWVYPLALIGVSLVSISLFSYMTLKGSASRRYSLRAVSRTLREFLPTALIDFTGNSYGSTPVPIATATLSPAAASSFSSAERLYRLALMSVAALGDAFQGWVLEPANPRPIRRQLAAILSHLVLGMVGGTLLAILAPPLTGFVFGQDVAATTAQALFLGIALLFISSTTPLIRNILIPSGMFRWVFVATSVAAVLGLVTMIAFGMGGSSAGIAAGLAASEMLIFLLLLPPSISQLRATTRHERQAS